VEGGAAATMVEFPLNGHPELGTALASDGFWRGRLPDDSLQSEDWRMLGEASPHLPRDEYALDAGRYRSFDRYILTCRADNMARLEATPTATPYRQSLAYNPELGDIARRYPRSRVLRPENTALLEIMRCTVPVLRCLAGAVSFMINVHHIRYLVLPDRPARNSPAGYHRDGERFISVHLLDRQHVVGGANRIADQAENMLSEFTLTEPGDCFIIDDDLVLHAVDEMTVEPSAASGTRDILLIDYMPS
jgi:hypothetical protein